MMKKLCSFFVKEKFFEGKCDEKSNNFLKRREKFFQAERQKKRKKHSRDAFLKAKNNTLLQVMKKNSLKTTTRAMKMMKREE
tara:strand:- start:371 stop:616 length:246 start_codon:yes stop_codon:yes gene_type:complete